MHAGEGGALSCTTQRHMHSSKRAHSKPHTPHPNNLALTLHSPRLGPHLLIPRFLGLLARIHLLLLDVICTRSCAEEGRRFRGEASVCLPVHGHPSIGMMVCYLLHKGTPPKREINTQGAQRADKRSSSYHLLGAHHIHCPRLGGWRCSCVEGCGGETGRMQLR